MPSRVSFGSWTCDHTPCTRPRAVSRQLRRRRAARTAGSLSSVCVLARRHDRRAWRCCRQSSSSTVVGGTGGAAAACPRHPRRTRAVRAAGCCCLAPAALDGRRGRDRQLSRLLLRAGTCHLEGRGRDRRTGGPLRPGLVRVSSPLTDRGRRLARGAAGAGSCPAHGPVLRTGLP